MLQKLRVFLSPLETMPMRRKTRPLASFSSSRLGAFDSLRSLSQKTDPLPSLLFSTSCFLRCGKVTGSERVVFNLSGAFDRCQTGRHSFSLAELRPSFRTKSINGEILP